MCERKVLISFSNSKQSCPQPTFGRWLSVCLDMFGLVTIRVENCGPFNFVNDTVKVHLKGTAMELI